jgi:hypothetical protein
MALSLRDPVNGYVYTTIQTCAQRERELRAAKFDVVVIDESHWGEGKRSYETLIEQLGHRAVFIGLTATPREGTDFSLVGREYGLHELIRMGVLAEPIVEPVVRTGVRWSPSIVGNGDFDASSVSRLAKHPARNRLIVDTLHRERLEYGKTLVFACDVEHAETLCGLMQQRGISAEAVHSGMRLEDRRTAIARFSAGKTRVLVNVAMMTHGVDIPDIETVVLARPTASRILFAQMVGRAARKTATKTHFHLVDFQDDLSEHAEMLWSPARYFGSLGPSPAKGRYTRSPARSVHAYAKATFEHVPSVAGYGEIAGFDLQPDQTFGVEIELTRDGFVDDEMPADWMAKAKALLQAIPAPKAAKPVPRGEGKQHDVWNVEYDGSCGWEVTSRVLSGSAGFFEIMDVCRALEPLAATLGLVVNHRTGMHVHLGWKRALPSLRRLMSLTAHFEPALYSLVAPSRFANGYAQSIRQHLALFESFDSLDDWKAHFGERESRYLAVNPANLFGGLDTVEVRMHSGTLEGTKILGWLSLWMRLLDSAQGRQALPEGAPAAKGEPLTTGPGGDVVALADHVGAHRELTAYLRARRENVMARWLEHPQLGRVARRVAATWG